MPDFMANNSCNLGFIVGSFDSSTVDVNWPTGQCEGIDRTVIDKFERKRELIFVRRLCHQPLPKSIDVCVCVGIIDQYELFLRILGHFPPHLDILLWAENICPSGTESGALADNSHAEQQHRNNGKSRSIHGEILLKPNW